LAAWLTLSERATAKKTSICRSVYRISAVPNLKL
jgi:hypothetical protein